MLKEEDENLAIKRKFSRTRKSAQKWNSYIPDKYQEPQNQYHAGLFVLI